MTEAMKYRKKPVVIDAMLWDGAVENAHPIIQWINSTEDNTATWTEGHTFDEDGEGIWFAEGIYIRTLEGTMRVAPGDYVIKGVQGEFYPCKPDIFDATYEKEEDNNGPYRPTNEKPNPDSVPVDKDRLINELLTEIDNLAAQHDKVVKIAEDLELKSKEAHLCCFVRKEVFDAKESGDSMSEVLYARGEDKFNRYEEDKLIEAMKNSSLLEELLKAASEVVAEFDDKIETEIQEQVEDDLKDSDNG